MTTTGYSTSKTAASIPATASLLVNCFADFPQLIQFYPYCYCIEQ